MSQQEERRQCETEKGVNKIKSQELEELPLRADTLLDVVDVDDRLREQLKLLRQRLAETKDQTLDTDLDKIHRRNLAKGRNKYKILRQLNNDNIQQKVKIFESM